MFRPYLRSLKNFRARNTAGYRQFTSRANTNSSTGILTKRTAARVTVFTVSSVLLATTCSTVFADNGAETVKESSLGSYVRAYTVYTMCSVPALVDASPRLLSFFTSIPGIKQITEAFVRITFFDQVWVFNPLLLFCITVFFCHWQFVGGDSITETLSLIRSLRSANKGVLVAYSVEVDENQATGGSSKNVSTTPPHKRIVDEMLHSIDVAADLEEEFMSKSPSVRGKRTWVAIKMTALLPDAGALLALSSLIVESRKDHRTPVKYAAVPFPGSARKEDLDVILKTPPSIGHLTPAEVSGVRELYDDLVRICTRARERGIKIIIDAEYRYVVLFYYIRCSTFRRCWMSLLFLILFKQEVSFTDKSYSWYQPAIDALTLALMREFNSLDAKKSRGQVQPLVYGTFQAYLRR